MDSLTKLLHVSKLLIQGTQGIHQPFTSTEIEQIKIFFIKQQYKSMYLICPVLFIFEVINLL